MYGCRLLNMGTCKYVIAVAAVAAAAVVIVVVIDDSRY